MTELSILLKFAKAYVFDLNVRKLSFEDIGFWPLSAERSFDCAIKITWTRDISNFFIFNCSFEWIINITWTHKTTHKSIQIFENLVSKRLGCAPPQPNAHSTTLLLLHELVTFRNFEFNFCTFINRAFCKFQIHMYAYRTY